MLWQSGAFRVNAEREYVNAADLLPNDADLQVRAGLFLAAAGRMEEAKARAERALSTRAKDRCRRPVSSCARRSKRICPSLSW